MSLKIWTGTAWVTNPPRAYMSDGNFRSRPVMYWNGSKWAPEPFITQNYNMTSTALTFSVAAPSTPPAPPVQTYTETKSFGLLWGQTYKGDNNQRTDNNYLYQGYSTASNGNLKSLLGFSPSIPGSATCLEATLTLYANHWYWNSGGEVSIGTHTYGSKPATYNSANVWNDRLRYSWNTKTGQRTINLGTAIGQDFIAGSHKGIVIGPGPTTGTTHYGYFTQTGGFAPVLTIKYQYTA